jgi:hypothetical protein
MFSFTSILVQDSTLPDSMSHTSTACRFLVTEAHCGLRIESHRTPIALKIQLGHAISSLRFEFMKKYLLIEN